VSFTITTTFLTLQSSYCERLKLVIACPSDCRGWYIVQADKFLGNQAGTRRYRVIPQDGAGRRNQEEERKKYHNKQADNVIICQKAVYLV